MHSVAVIGTERFAVTGSILDESNSTEGFVASLTRGLTLSINTPPTGTPILTGNFKVGQTISIDASGIDDADNTEGWAPTYEYSWEVSEDNGTTWTELNSADATDGDDSYTLTTAEVGEQLRGVVSYLMVMAHLKVSLVQLN